METAAWRRAVLFGENLPDLSRKINRFCHHKIRIFREEQELDDSKPPKSKKDPQKRMVFWIVKIFCLTVAISSAFSLISSILLDDASPALAFLLLIFIIAIGIVFDVVGVAVTAADVRPFHSMAAKKKKGAKEAVNLIQNADHVSSICNDVIGDICGIVSGSASAAIVASALAGLMKPTVATIIMSALVAGLTVGGKAIGKYFAIHNATGIVLLAAKVVYYLKVALPGTKKKKKRVR